jgi:hypothetical protein
MLIDIMQEIQQRSVSCSSEEDSKGELLQRVPSHKIANVIFYSTLGELLLNHFLDNYLKSFSLKSDIRQNLIDDVRSSKEKSDQLFRSFSGLKLSTVVKHIDAKYGVTHWTEAFLNYIHVRRLRNDIVHAGAMWNLDNPQIDAITNEIPNLVKLFVELHNECVHPRYYSR